MASSEELAVNKEASSKPKPAKPAPQKLSVWEAIRMRGIVYAVTSEVKECEIMIARKEKAIVAKECQARKLLMEAEELRTEVAELKVIIFRNSKS